MKKGIILASLTFVSMLVGVSCAEQTSDNPVQQQGSVRFGIANNYDIKVSSRAEAPAGESYAVVVKSNVDQSVVFNGTYGMLGMPLVLNTGSYNVAAENCSAEAAQTMPDARGQLRMAGNTNFIINVGETTEVAFTCTVANAKVSVAYAESFNEVFKDVTVEVCEASNEDRVLAYTGQATIDTEIGYFNVNGKTTLSAKVTATRNDGTVVNSLVRVEDVDAAEWHKLTFGVDKSQGEGSFDISCDDTITSVESTHNIDPYAGV